MDHCLFARQMKPKPVTVCISFHLIQFWFQFRQGDKLKYSQQSTIFANCHVRHLSCLEFACLVHKLHSSSNFSKSEPGKGYESMHIIHQNYYSKLDLLACKAEKRFGTEPFTRVDSNCQSSVRRNDMKLGKLDVQKWVFQIFFLKTFLSWRVKIVNYFYQFLIATKFLPSQRLTMRKRGFPSWHEPYKSVLSELMD